MRIAKAYLYWPPVLLLCAGAIIPTMQQTSGTLDPSQTNALSEALFAAAELLAVVHLARRPRRTWQLLSQQLPLLAVVLFVIVSALWSGEPDVTLRKATALTGTTALGIVFASSLPLRVQLRVLATTAMIAIVLSFTAGLLIPGVGLEPLSTGDSAWRGIFVTKNVHARFMVFAAVVFYFCASGARTTQARWAYRIGIIAATALIFLSGSATALVVLAAIFAVQPALRLARLRTALAVPLLLCFVGCCAVALVWVALNSETAASALGRDASLTGRTYLWILVIQAILDRPWLGYGFGVFWAGWNGASAGIWSQTGWQPPHAHNGFLDLWLDVGIVGLVLLLASLGVGTRKAWGFLKRARSPESLWPITCLGFLVLYNLTESSLVRQNSLFWVVYVAALALPVAELPAIVPRHPDGYRDSAGIVLASATERSAVAAARTADA